MVVELSGLQRRTARARVRVRRSSSGHAIGNQHWPAVVKGTRMYVPLTVDRKVMDSVMRTHAFPGIRHEFVPGTEVIAYLAPHESRRLFGGADSTPHAHLPPRLSAHDAASRAAPSAVTVRLLQFGDSMFPVGAFAFSNGLEMAVQHGVVTTGRTLQEFVRTVTPVAATGDGVACSPGTGAPRAGDLGPDPAGRRGGLHPQAQRGDADHDRTDGA